VRIILNADDFGFSQDTVRATIECFERGALTSATIMPNMPASPEALEFARRHPEHTYGVHLTFVGDGFEQPVSRPDEIPALVDARGRLPTTNRARARALFRLQPVDQIEREVAAQIRAVRDGGVAVTHVDSHRHLHKFAPFRLALRRTLPRFGISRVRNVQDVYLRRPLTSPTFWLGHMWRRSLMREFDTTDHFYMPASAGDESWQELIPWISAQPQSRTLEVGVHPGFEEDWRDHERRSTESFAQGAASQGHTLVDWRDIGPR
jgi:predicted glycoside hydrolase/deacetylase ChbG (UPF0249 family)